MCRLKASIFGPVLALLVAGAAIAALAFAPSGAPPPLAPHMATAQVFPERGHGSGIHIGDGYVLTAAHVVADDEDGIVELRTFSGLTPEARVMWTSARYDIALLRTEADQFPAAVALSCTVPALGSAFTTMGNPGPMTDMLFHGTIASGAQEIGPWARAVHAQIVALPGQSGSGMWNAEGELIGVLVGTVRAPISVYSVSYTGVGIAVPASVVCDLLTQADRDPT